MKRIGKIIALYGLILFSFASATAQNTIDGVLRKYKNDETVTSIKYQGENLNKAVKSQKKDLKTKLDYIDIVGFKNKDISAKDKTSIESLLAAQNFEELVNVKSKDGLIKISTLYKGDIINKIFAQFTSKEMGNFYAILSGDIHLEEVSQIVSNLNMQELDFLKTISNSAPKK